VRAAELVPGDTVATRAGTATVVRVAPHDAPEVVYNLHVEGTARYLVGACGAVVHNSPCDRAREAAAEAARRGFVKDIATKNTRNWSAMFKSEGEARALARQKVGSNAVMVEEGKLRSADGTWQYRAKPSDLAENHIHLEQLNPVTGEVIQNVHLRWPQGAGR